MFSKKVHALSRHWATKSLAFAATFIYFMSLSVSVDTFADVPAAGCEGLRTAEGSWSQNLQRNKQAQAQRCGPTGNGQGSALHTDFKKIEDKLKICDSISPSQTIGANPILEAVVKRYSAVCLAQRHYITGADSICLQYGRVAGAVREAEQASPNCGQQAACLTNISNQYKTASDGYFAADRSASALAREMKQKAVSTTKQGDAEMTRLFEQLRRQVLDQTAILKRQASTRTANGARQAIASDVGGDGGAWGTAMRWDNPQQVREYWRKLGQCESVSGDIQRLAQKYQRDIGAPTGAMIAEAEAGQRFFNKEAADYRQNQEQTAAAARRLSPSPAIVRAQEVVDSNPGAIGPRGEPRPNDAIATTNSDQLRRLYRTDDPAEIEAQIRAAGIVGASTTAEPDYVAGDGTRYRVLRQNTTSGQRLRYIRLR